jgi:hypothetical protein
MSTKDEGQEVRRARIAAAAVLGGKTAPEENPAKAAGTANLLRVVVTVSGRRYDEDLATQAMIVPNIEALDEALATNPGRFAEWAMLEATARAGVAMIAFNIAVLESQIKDREARFYIETVDAAAVTGSKPTVDYVKAKVATDPERLQLAQRRQELEAEMLDAKASLDTLSVGKKTMEEKKDSLLELSRNWRQEMVTKLTVNAGQFRPGGDPLRRMPNT